MAKYSKLSLDEVREKILVRSVRAMMEMLGCTKENAMELLKIPYKDFGNDGRNKTRMKRRDVDVPSLFAFCAVLVS